VSSDSWCDFGIEQGSGVPKGDKFKEQLRMLQAKHHPIKQAPRFTRVVGRYNLLRNEDSAALAVSFDAGAGLMAISVTVTPDSEDDYGGSDPFEAMKVIERVGKSYFIDTGAKSVRRRLTPSGATKLSSGKLTTKNVRSKLKLRPLVLRSAHRAYNDYLDSLE
jgi:hypothetical protein